jgi:hypothetical protein
VRTGFLLELRNHDKKTESPQTRHDGGTPNAQTHAQEGAAEFFKKLGAPIADMTVDPDNQSTLDYILNAHPKDLDGILDRIMGGEDMID